MSLFHEIGSWRSSDEAFLRFHILGWLSYHDYGVNKKLKVTMPDAGTAAQLSLVINIAAVPLECRNLFKISISTMATAN